MKWWRRILRFFRSGRNADSEKFPESETLDGEVVPQQEIGTMLAIRETEEQKSDDRYEKFRGTPLMKAIAPSGIWIVIKFSDALEAGQFSEDFRSAQIVKARSGEDAIRKVYTADLQKHGAAADLTKAKAEDGRYVALDFYTGHRVEHAVRGGWQAELYA